MSRIRSKHPRRGAIVQACAVACLLHAGPAALAAVVSLGDVPGVLSGTLFVGRTGVGSLTIDGGSLLQAERVSLGDQRTGVGTLTVIGTGSLLRLTDLPFSAVDLGGWGNGTLQVLAGGAVTHTPLLSCALCNVIVGNASGSTGQVAISGAGSTFSTSRDLYVGSTNVQTYTDANGNLGYWGTPGGTTQAAVRIDSGGRFDSRAMYIGFDQPDRPAQTGTEVSIGTVLVDGAHSAVNLVRTTLISGDTSLLAVGHSGGGSGTLDVRNGGRVTLDGGVAPGNFSGIGIGAGDGTSRGTMRIDGAGSFVQLSGGIGFVNVGTGANAKGTLEVTGGALLSGLGSTGLPFLNVGRNGGTGSTLVSGADASGTASTIHLTGQTPLSNTGASLQVGRTESGRAGDGTLRIQAGGQVLVDSRGEVLNNPSGQSGFQIGWGEASVGRLEVSGRNAITGGASTLSSHTGTGVANWVAIGRDGASGSVTVSDGGRIVLDSQRISTPNAGGVGHLPGDAQFFNIGRRLDSGTSASTGVVTVTGVGSELVLSGATDSLFLVGFGNNATGTLNLLAGGSASANTMLLGNGVAGSGKLTVDGGVLTLAGQQNGGATPGAGASLTAGRNDGTGTIHMSNGALIDISSATATPSFQLGGSTVGIGGTGIATLQDGSRIVVHGTDAIARIGTTGSTAAAGIGLMTLATGSRLDVTGSGGRIRVGSGADTVGTLLVGTSASISATSLIGIAHDGSASTAGTGTLIVHGSATAPLIAVGQNGLLGGNGTVIGNVVNSGVIAPGASPGRLSIDGSLDSRDGRLVMDIEQQADGSWRYDELVVTDWLNSFIGGAQIEFEFLGGSDPLAFLNDGLFTLGSFFKQGDGAGGVSGLTDTAMRLFTGASFSAHSGAYDIRNFSFTVADGARLDIGILAVPEPSALLLTLAALAAMGLFGTTGRRRWALRPQRSRRPSG